MFYFYKYFVLLLLEKICFAPIKMRYYWSRCHWASNDLSKMK